MTGPGPAHDRAPAEQRVVLVGGGVAAVRTAQSLRDLGHTGPITLLSEELEPPYDRPPLSKRVLTGPEDGGAARLLPEGSAEELRIDVRLGHRVTGLDTRGRTVQVEGSPDPVAYDAVVVATGTRARTLDVLRDVPGVHHLRTADDARTIRGSLRDGGRLVLVGAGFVGLEVAAAAVDHGVDVTVVEVAERPLVAVLGDELAGWLQDWHARRGVRFVCGTGVEAVRRTSDGLVLTTTAGAELVADDVVVGVGVHRDLAWLDEAGLTTHLGLVCDEDGRTAEPGVFGAGDVVCVHRGEVCRPVQHWTAATDSARRVARAVLGLAPEPITDEGYFWSDQGPLRLMSVGHCRPGARLEVVSGELATDRFVVRWTLDEEVVGVVGANSPREFLRSRMAFRRGLSPVGQVC